MTTIKRSAVEEQLATVKRAFLKNGIDLGNSGAGLTLYKSLIRAKNRTKRDESYIKKGIKFKFNNAERKALIEIIKAAPTFWNEWITNQEIYEASGYNEDLRPSLHRPDNFGNYQFGNIAVLPYGEHLKENAVKTPIVMIDENGKFYFDVFESKREAQNELNMTNNTLKKIQKDVHELTYKDEEGEITQTGRLTVPMKYIESKPKNEGEYKAFCKEYGLIYEAPEVRATRDANAIANMKIKGQI